MPENPVVSVIIPAYNRALTIGRAVRSVLTQTFEDFEIVVVDDGSTDATLEVVQTQNDPRIRVVRHDRNLGAAAARNTGIRSAAGFYVAFLDSDDEWYPQKLAQQLLELRRADPQVRACTTGFTLVQPDGVKDYYPEEIIPLQKKLLWGCDFGPGTTLLVERTIFDEIGLLDEALPRLEDWDWLIRYAEKYEILVVKRPLARVNRPSAWPSPKKLEEATLYLLDKHRERFKAFGSEYKKQTLARRWREVAWAYYEIERNLPKERLYFWLTITTDPAQPAGVYLALLDAWLGTKIRPLASRIKARLFKGRKG